MKKMVLCCVLCYGALCGWSLAQSPCAIFYDGFETGVLGSHWQYSYMASSVFNYSVTTTNPAIGTYAFEHAHYSYFPAGSNAYTIFTSSQPSYMSFWVRANSTNGILSGVMVTDSNFVNNSLFYMVLNQNSQMAFHTNAQPSAYYPITANTWYHVEARDMDWSARNMDIWINGTLFLNNWDFRTTTVTQIDRIYLMSTDPGIITYDDIRIGFIGPRIDTELLTMPTCPGMGDGSIDLSTSSPNGNMGYAWSTGDTTQDLVNLAAGTYTVTMTDVLGCSAIDSVILLDPGALAVAPQVTAVACPLDSTGAIDLSPAGGTPGYTYAWSTGDTAQDLNNLAAGLYAFTLTDAHGCTHTDTLVVTGSNPFDPQAILTAPSCFAGSDGQIQTQVIGGTPGYALSWNTGATTAGITGLAAGAYQLHITDAQGCATHVTYMLTAPSALTANGIVIHATTLPAPGAIDLTPAGGIPPYTYLWSNNATTEDLTNLGSGNYHVTITDANGCVTHQSFLVDLVVGASWPLTARVRAWPNPFDQSLNLDVQGMGNEAIQADIHDLAGRLLWQQTLAQDGQQEILLDLPAGSYLLELRQGHARATIMLVKP